VVTRAVDEVEPTLVVSLDLVQLSSLRLDTLAEDQADAVVVGVGVAGLAVAEHRLSPIQMPATIARSSSVKS
jgi:hypothetical protein